MSDEPTLTGMGMVFGMMAITAGLLAALEQRGALSRENTDSTAQALSSGAFLYDIEPSMFDERYIVMETQFGAGLIGSVDQMIETPEPAGGALAALLALAVLARRRHHATASSCRAASDPPRESGGFAGGTS